MRAIRVKSLENAIILVYLKLLWKAHFLQQKIFTIAEFKIAYEMYVFSHDSFVEHHSLLIAQVSLKNKTRTTNHSYEMSYYCRTLILKK